MDIMRRPAFALMLAITLLPTTIGMLLSPLARLQAQADPPAADARAPGAETMPPAIAPRTAKERLGKKWTDEQRIDNCKVPLDQRGSQPRPDGCSRTPDE